jgi:hypothetical protein
VKLTRRDALAALAGTGIVLGSGAAAFSREGAETLETDDTGSGNSTDALPSVDETLATLVATAEVVYPSTVDGIPEFVETYSLGRVDHRAEYLQGVREAAADLDTHAQLWFDAESFATLGVDQRDDLLHEMGVHTAEEQPDGTIAERVRHFVVNDLLYALYTSTTGSELVGLENPPGHPGGTESYRRGPR